METDAISQLTRLAKCWEKCSKTSQLVLRDTSVWNLTIFKNCTDPWQPSWKGTVYISQAPVKKAWPTRGLSRIMVTWTNLSSGHGVSHFLRGWSPDCTLGMWMSRPKGWQQLLRAPRAGKPVGFTSGSQAEDQDYRAIQELIFLIHPKWNTRIYNGWLHWKNVCLKTF